MAKNDHMTGCSCGCPTGVQLTGQVFAAILAPDAELLRLRDELASTNRALVQVYAERDALKLRLADLTAEYRGYRMAVEGRKEMQPLQQFAPLA